MTIQEMKSKMISLGLVKTKTDKKIFNEIKGTRTFQHSTAGIQVKNLKTDLDVINAWETYVYYYLKWEKHNIEERKINHSNWIDYSSQAYNNSSDDL